MCTWPPCGVNKVHHIKCRLCWRFGRQSERASAAQAFGDRDINLGKKLLGFLTFMPQRSLRACLCVLIVQGVQMQKHCVEFAAQWVFGFALPVILPTWLQGSDSKRQGRPGKDIAVMPLKIFSAS